MNENEKAVRKKQRLYLPVAVLLEDPGICVCVQSGISQDVTESGSTFFYLSPDITETIQILKACPTMGKQHQPRAYVLV